MKQNILFITCSYSHNQNELFFNKSKRGYQHAAQNFQEALLEGFIANKDVNLNVASIPSLSTYPFGCKLIRVPDSDYYFNNKMIGKSFGFLNLPFFNVLHQNRIDEYIDYWYENTKGEKAIIVYAMLKKQMQYAVEAKKRYPDIKLCLVIPDLPIYMGCNKYYKMLGFQKRDIKSLYSMVPIFDCYVVLAKPIIDYLKIKEKPFIVIEGIYNLKCGNVIEKKLLPFTIMYSGGIQTRYGVFDLLDALYEIENRNIRLILCGGCNEEKKLKSYIKRDKRIEYLGILPTSEVRLLQKKVSLLVNPRHSTEEFTKYSFPSKTLEYMASGTPVLMSSLPSMPDEYKQYLYLFKNEDIDGIKNAIENCINISNKELISKGAKAQTFILQYKNSKTQVSKILDLLNECN